MLLRFVGAHECLCKAYAPKYYEDLEDKIILGAKESYEASLLKEAKREMKQKYLDEYQEQMIIEASEGVIKAQKAKVREEVLAEYKETLKKEIRQE